VRAKEKVLVRAKEKVLVRAKEKVLVRAKEKEKAKEWETKDNPCDPRVRGSKPC